MVCSVEARCGLQSDPTMGRSDRRYSERWRRACGCRSRRNQVRLDVDDDVGRFLVEAPTRSAAHSVQIVKCAPGRAGQGRASAPDSSLTVTASGLRYAPASKSGASGGQLRAGSQISSVVRRQQPLLPVGASRSPLSPRRRSRRGGRGVSRRWGEMPALTGFAGRCDLLGAKSTSRKTPEIPV